MEVRVFPASLFRAQSVELLPDLPDDENGGGKRGREGMFPFGRPSHTVEALTIKRVWG